MAAKNERNKKMLAQAHGFLSPSFVSFGSSDQGTKATKNEAGSRGLCFLCSLLFLSFRRRTDGQHQGNKESCRAPGQT
jgi:hypothetical protein